MAEADKNTNFQKEQTDKPKSKAKRIISAILLGFFIFFIVFAGASYGYFKYYQNKVYPGVKIAGYDVGGLSRTDAEKLIDKKISNIKNVGLVLSKEDVTSTYDVALGDLGIDFDKNETLEKAYAVARIGKSDFDNALSALALVFSEKNISLITTFEEEKFQSKINEMLGPELVKHENAHIKVVDGHLEIVSEINGMEVNFLKLKEQIHEVLNSSNVMQKIVIKTETRIPEITVSDIEVNKPLIEKYLNKKVTFKDEGYYYTPTKEDIAKWIHIKKENGEMLVELSDDEMRKYVANLASSVDSSPSDKKIEESSGRVINEGHDGRTMNQENAFSGLKNAMLGLDKDTLVQIQTQTIPRKEVKIKSYSGSGTPGLAPGKYLEINLSKQVMYAYEGEHFVGSYMVSTGAWDHPTPVGTRYIQDKSARPFSAQYGLYMPWWSGLGGGYGIHELPEWPGGYKEGESHLGTPVSHGCIRLGVGPAEFVYHWAPIGTPVFIHY